MTRQRRRRQRRPIFACAVFLIATLAALTGPATAMSAVADSDVVGPPADGPCVYVSTDPPSVTVTDRCPEGEVIVFDEPPSDAMRAATTPQ